MLLDLEISVEGALKALCVFLVQHTKEKAQSRHVFSETDLVEGHYIGRQWVSKAFLVCFPFLQLKSPLMPAISLVIGAVVLIYVCSRVWESGG